MKLIKKCPHGVPSNLGCIQCISKAIDKFGKLKQCMDPACVDSKYCPEVGTLKHGNK